MEEAWELAVVSESQDFSDRFVAAYNKYTYVSSVTIIICILNVSKSSKFFGIEMNDVNERWVETLFFLASLALLWNYITRLMDERYILLVVDRNLNKVLGKLRSTIQEIDDVNEIGKLVLSDYNESLRSSENRVVRSVTQSMPVDLPVDYLIQEKLKEKLFSEGEYFTSDEYLEVVFENFKASARSKSDDGGLAPYLLGDRHIEKFMRTFSNPLNSNLERNFEIVREAEKNFKLIANQLSRLDFISKDFLTFLGWSKVRLWTVDVAIPVTLFASLLWSFLNPNEVLPFIEWVGGLGQ